MNDVAEIAGAAEAGGADAVTVGNTLLGLAVDWRAGKPKLARGSGGLSGPAIRPAALHHAARCAAASAITVIGCGGIRTAEDALEFLCVGCKAVQVGTAAFVDPYALPRLVEELSSLLAEAGCYGTLEPDKTARRDIERGLAVAQALGEQDVGQAVVVQQGVVLV